MPPLCGFGAPLAYSPSCDNIGISLSFSLLLSFLPSCDCIGLSLYFSRSLDLFPFSSLFLSPSLFRTRPCNPRYIVEVLFFLNLISWFCIRLVVYPFTVVRFFALDFLMSPILRPFFFVGRGGRTFPEKGPRPPRIKKGGGNNSNILIEPGCIVIGRLLDRP